MLFRSYNYKNEVLSDFMLLSVNNMEFSYKDRKILNGINFTVEKGDFISILGIKKRPAVIVARFHRNCQLLLIEISHNVIEL